MWKDLGSVATAASNGDVAGFPAIRAIVETIHTKAHVVLSLADGAVLFADAALFRQIALRTNGGSLHKGPPRKLYLSSRGAARRRSGGYSVSFTCPFEGATNSLLRGFFDPRVGAC